MIRINNRGFTLIELLAVIVIASIFMILTTTIYTKAFSNYSNIKADNVLRFEADIIMTSLIREIYITPEKNIEYLNDPSSNVSYLNIQYPTNTSTPSFKTGFFKNKIVVKDQVHTISEEVTVLWNQSGVTQYTNANDETIYTITLTLQNSRGYTKIFKSQVQSIKRKKEDTT